VNYKFLSREQWFRLSLKTRKRWWKETDYGTLDPSADLMKAILEELTKGKPDGVRETHAEPGVEDEGDPAGGSGA
jgi:hypothetical protein